MLQDDARNLQAPYVPGRTHLRLIAGGVVLYWAVFWIMNGMDKFLCGRDLPGFRWHGKDRTDQFSTYLHRIEVDASLVEPILIFAGIWEIALGLVFLSTLWSLVRAFPSAAVFSGMSITVSASILTFVGFSAFDVVVGDRAELLEHGTYMMLILVSWLVVNAGGRLAHAEPAGSVRSPCQG